MVMRACVAAAACLSVLVAASLARAEEIRHRTDYAIALAGLPVARASFDTELVNDRYTISGTMNSAGLADILSRTSGQTQVTGTLMRDRLRASHYSMSYRSGSKQRSIEMTLRNGTVTSSVMTPKRTTSPDNWIPVSAADMRNVFDPLSGLIIPARNRVCPKTLPIFDGESRLDIRLSPKGTRPFKTEGFEGEAIVCGLAFTPKSGFKKGRKDVEYLAKLKTMEIWFAKAEAVNVYAPVYVRIPTSLGAVTVSATRFGG
ncbi:DUF3108 domain-containing protein [Rhizobium sp. SG2393]|uniref:DUF3108 domain-containing protein n=1 Tax=Rhizobium sp. SG2393 TaxID=3276279 RepID=UPI00366EA1FA